MSLKHLSQSWIVVGRQYSNKSSKKTAFSFLVSVPHGDIVQIWHSCRSNLCKLRLGFARFPTKQNASRSKYLIPADCPRCVCSPNTQPRDHFGVRPLASRQYHVFRLCRSYHLLHHTIYWILFAACDMPNACHNRGAGNIAIHELLWALANRLRSWPSVDMNSCCLVRSTQTGSTYAVTQMT